MEGKMIYLIWFLVLALTSVLNVVAYYKLKRWGIHLFASGCVASLSVLFLIEFIEYLINN